MLPAAADSAQGASLFSSVKPARTSRRGMRQRNVVTIDAVPHAIPPICYSDDPAVVCRMPEKIKKRFGVWMDTYHATIVGYKPAAAEFTVLGRAKNPGPGANSNENAAHNLEITLAQKYFKEIGRLLGNADEVHLTGTGTIQEQFRRYLGETPQFKKTVVTESTSKPMGDEQLVEFVRKHFK